MKVIKIGRSSANDIVIQNDAYVGRTHCEIIRDDNGGYWINDLNSTNGTFVNGVRRSGQTKLNSNDIVRIGNTTLPWKNYFSNGTVAGTCVAPPVYNPPAPPVSEPPTTQKGSGFGIASLICGILGINLLAIIFGGVSLSRKEKNSGLGIAGLILGIVWMILGLLVFIGS